MGLIVLENMEFYAYHGCFEQERIIGNHFLVTLQMKTDTSKAELTDSLEDTLNYNEVYLIVKKEMATPSKLLEHVAARILDVLFSSFDVFIEITVKVSKLNPPIEGKIESVSVQLSRKR